MHKYLKWALYLVGGYTIAASIYNNVGGSGAATTGALPNPIGNLIGIN
jgi:hypothetical protein